MFLKDSLVLGDEIKELGKKSTITFLGNGCGYIVNFLSTIVIGKLIGAEMYGQFTYIVSFLTFFLVVSKLGLESGIVSFLSRNTISINEKRSLLSYTLLIVGFISILFIILGYVQLNFINKNLLNGEEYRTLFIILLPTVFIDSITAILRSSLRAFRKIQQIVLAGNIVIPSIKIIATIILIYVFKIKNTKTLVIALYFSSIFLLLYYVYEVKKVDLFGKINKKFNNKQIILFSLPLLLAGVTSVLTQNIDKYMLGYLVGAKEVGIYRAAIQFAGIPTLALGAVNIIFGPLISNLYYDGHLENLGKMYSLATKAITIFALFIFGIILLFSTEIMGFAGAEFKVGGTVLILVALGQVFNAAVGSVGLINSMTGHPNLSFLASFISMALNILLNSLLIKPFGMNGAAIATMSSVIIGNSIGLIFVYKNLKIQPYDMSFIRLLVCFILATGSVYILAKFISTKLSILCLIIYCIIFIALLYKFVLSKKEIATILKTIKKK